MAGMIIGALLIAWPLYLASKNRLVDYAELM